jgi:hypothetical protein
LSIIVLIAVAFSDDLVEAAQGKPDPGRVLVTDIPLLIAAFVLTMIGQLVTGRIAWLSTLILYLIGSVLTLGVDAYIARTNLVEPYPLWPTLAYYLAFLLLVLASITVNPIRLIGKTGADVRARLASATPLLIGTLGAYAASYAWRFTGAGINQEYFAQISQVIPLLFVAIGLEGRYFQRSDGKTSEYGLTAVLLILLVMGEVMALSALVPYNGPDRPALTSWHQYFALVATAFACSAALAALVLTVNRIIDPAQPSTRRVAAGVQMPATSHATLESSDHKWPLMVVGLAIGFVLGTLRATRR